MQSLFDCAYPHAPGYRDQDTSKAAAIDLRESSSAMREKVYAVLSKPLTDWQIAEATGLSFENCQPRRSELVAEGLVEFSGEYGVSARSGKRVKKWIRI